MRPYVSPKRCGLGQQLIDGIQLAEDLRPYKIVLELTGRVDFLMFPR